MTVICKNNQQTDEQNPTEQVDINSVNISVEDQADAAPTFPQSMSKQTLNPSLDESLRNDKTFKNDVNSTVNNSNINAALEMEAANQCLEDPETGEVIFPVKQLNSLDDMVNRTRWIVPVLPGGDLEQLILHSTLLVKQNIDKKSEHCQRFFREGLATSFHKILTDDAVSGWKPEIQRCINQNSILLLDLCILKLPQDCIPLLELEALVFCPTSKYHQHSIGRFHEFRIPLEILRDQPTTASTSSSIEDSPDTPQTTPEVPIQHRVYGECRESRCQLVILVDFINYFGRNGGFDALLSRFRDNKETLTLPAIHAQLKPFGLCCDYLTKLTIETYFREIVEIVINFLHNLTDEDLKKESKTESKNDCISGIVRTLQCLMRKMPGQEENARDMELLRLKLILRVLQVAPFNGKMNALIELNRLIQPLHTIYTPRNFRGETEAEMLSAEKVALWIQSNDVLSIILRENLHQPQYVEKIEKIVRFMIKEKALSQSELDRIWDAQEGKHEAIVKNIHDLLAKLAWDFTPEQLDHLFSCFQASWTRANRKQRERLIELIRRLAEEDKEGLMAQKVLGLLWEMAIGEDCPLEIMELALSAHKNILDFSCTQDRDAQKIEWIRQLVDILKSGDQSRYVIPAMKQMAEICTLFTVNSSSTSNPSSVTCKPPTPPLKSHTTPNRVYSQNNEVSADINVVGNDSHMPSLLTRSSIMSTTYHPNSLDCEQGNSSLDSNDRGNADSQHLHERQSRKSCLVIREDNELNTSNPLRRSTLTRSRSGGSTRFEPVDSAPQNYAPYNGRSQHNIYRNDVVNQIQKDHDIIALVAANLEQYMKEAREYKAQHPELTDPKAVFINSRFNHILNVSERLKFIRYLLREGMLYLYRSQAIQIWDCLAANAVFPEDREQCFRWFYKLMSEEPDLEPDCTQSFFERQVMKIEPPLLTNNGMMCFEIFFRHVNMKVGNLNSTRHRLILEDMNLIGSDYLWLLVTQGTEEVAQKAINNLRLLHTNLGPRLQAQQGHINEDFYQNCINRLGADFSTVKILMSSEPSAAPSADSVPDGAKHDQELECKLTRMVRVMTVLKEFLTECDAGFTAERIFPPLYRSSRGRTFSIIVRFLSQTTHRGGEDREIITHTNETIGRLRSRILKLKFPDSSRHQQQNRVELYYNNQLIDQYDDHRLISQFNFRENGIQPPCITAKVTNLVVPHQLASSPDSSSDSSHNGSPRHNRNRIRSGGTLGSSGGLTGPQGLPGSSYLTKDSTGADIIINSAEDLLPGVMMAKSGQYSKFLFEIGDMASEVNCSRLQDTVKDVLLLMPPDEAITRELIRALSNIAEDDKPSIESVLQAAGPTETLYRFQVLYQLMLPANDKEDEETAMYTYNFVMNGGLKTLLSILSSGEFLPKADITTRGQALISFMHLFLHSLWTLGYGYQNVLKFIADSPQVNLIKEIHHKLYAILQKVLPYPHEPKMLDKYTQSRRVGISMQNKNCVDELEALFPDLTVIKSLMKIAWSAASGSLELMGGSAEDIHQAIETCARADAGNEENSNSGPLLHRDDKDLAKESLECLSVCLALSPKHLDSLSKDKAWKQFVIDMILLCRSRHIRNCAHEQFKSIATNNSVSPADYHILNFFIQLLFTVLSNQVKTFAAQSMEYFLLLEYLLEITRKMKHSLQNTDALLNNEINWLKKARIDFMQGNAVEIDENLLQGHLKLCKELVICQHPDKKFIIGQDMNFNLIQELIEDFIFPASRQYLLLRRRQNSNKDLDHDAMDLKPAICMTQATIAEAFNLLIALVACCPKNMITLSDNLTKMYYPDVSTGLNEWEYLPPIGPRPHDGFVGLKNAGATCYMNSILQQLFQIGPLRDSVLSVNCGDEEYIEEEDTADNQGRLSLLTSSRTNSSLAEEANEAPENNSNKPPKESHHVAVLKHLQAIFGHLAYSKQQFYVPRGFWKQFKLWGDSVNLREQHDALEFFNCLVDNIDEALKSLGLPKVVESVMGGSFADQKICIGCPHRYSREESFTTLNVDIRNHENLLESLDQYVKGDLLEGDNAYFCENCAKKVDTVKRLCIQQLPPILAIQLKRFDYDWERDAAIKFNDYFEFPRELDMEPYTAHGLARAELAAKKAKLQEEDKDSSQLDVVHEEEESLLLEGSNCEVTRYFLKGVVVHSGQASGGHYYSYIRHRRGEDNYTWFKYDDNEVCEVKMDDFEEMRNQWFGGEFMGEVYDQMMKRMTYRKQKRWWNAYILFYEREDFLKAEEINQLSNAFKLVSVDESKPIPLPKSIGRLVQRQNIEYTHNKSQFTPEFFQFMKRLAECHFTELMSYLNIEQCDELYVSTVDLLIRFLFSVGFRTKKVLRGAASDWLKSMKRLLEASQRARQIFVESVFYRHTNRLPEYLLECPSPEIRQCFGQLIVLVAHKSIYEEPYHLEQIDTVINTLHLTYQQQINYFHHKLNSAHQQQQLFFYPHVLQLVLSLLNKEVMEYARHFTQFFRIFIDYLNLGEKERLHLLKLNVPLLFIRFSMDEGPGQPVKYGDIGRLISTVSLLIRCCDVSLFCQSSQSFYQHQQSCSANRKFDSVPLMSNPYAFTDEERIVQAPLIKLERDSDLACELFEQPSRFVKKMLDDTLNMQTYEDIKMFLKFCCFENQSYSTVVLDELIWMLTFSYSTDLRLFLALTTEVLSIDDSWQKHRILDFLKGHDDVDSILVTLLRVKNHQQKRSYQILKMLVRLFDENSVAQSVLQAEEDVAKRFRQAIEWLSDELERRCCGSMSGGGGQWAMSGGSHCVPSNEVSNSYFVERSDSALDVRARGNEIVQSLESDSDDQVIMDTTCDNLSNLKGSSSPGLADQRPDASVLPPGTVISDTDPPTTNQPNQDSPQQS